MMVACSQLTTQMLGDMVLQPSSRHLQTWEKLFSKMLQDSLVPRLFVGGPRYESSCKGTSRRLKTTQEYHQPERSFNSPGILRKCTITLSSSLPPHTPRPLRYVFAKTTQSGLTSFYALYLNSTQQTAYFEYRHESLDEGFRTISLPQVNLADGQFHHVAVAVFGSDFALFIDGRLHSPRRTLIAALQDGPGILFLGRRVQRPSRFAGVVL